MKIRRHIFWTFLYAAFVAAACCLCATVAEQKSTEVWGWDYQTFFGQIQDWRWIGYFGFRHPGLGLVMSPLVVLEHLWIGAYLLVMPAIATLTAWLIWRMSGKWGLLAWLSFPTTWLMASIPESFPVAQLALVASVCSVLCIGYRFKYRVVVAFAVLNTMITLTNGVKPMLGWLALNWKELDRKAIVRGAIGLAAMAVLGVGFFYVRTLMTGRGMGAGIEATLSWIPAERNIPRELYGFFIRPVGLVQSFIVYPLVAVGMCRAIHFRHKSLRLTSYSLLPILLSYFCVDLVIHLVIGWGMAEPWIFAPHWIWMLPLLLSEREARHV